MRDICAEAGLSTGAVYNYFRSKDEIVEAVGACGRDATARRLESLDTPDDAVGALTAVIDALMPMFDTAAVIESSRLDLRLWAEAVHTPRLQKVFCESRDASSAPFAEIVRRGQAGGALDAQLDPEAIARVLLSTLIGLQVQKAIDPDTNVAECTLAIRDLLERALPVRERGHE
jgi:AcrR family transcriptional regulator